MRCQLLLVYGCAVDFCGIAIVKSCSGIGENCTHLSINIGCAKVNAGNFSFVMRSLSLALGASVQGEESSLGQAVLTPELARTQAGYLLELIRHGVGVAVAELVRHFFDAASRFAQQRHGSFNAPLNPVGAWRHGRTCALMPARYGSQSGPTPSRCALMLELADNDDILAGRLRIVQF